MRVTLIGLGCGTWKGVTQEAREALEQAEAVIGAERLLEGLPDIPGQKRFAAVKTADILALAERGDASRLCVVFSGDTGFYSGAKALLPKLRERGIDCRVLAGVSSVQLLAARIGAAWQDWALCSAHGTDCDPVTAVMRGKPAFFLTGGAQTPASLCRALADAGLGALDATVGERLSYPDERILRATAAELADMAFAPLSVLLVEAAPKPYEGTNGIADGAFLRGEVPMTKQEVRAAALAKLAVRPDDTVWDVGAGTGSVSVELALAAREGRAYAVERSAEACALIRRNREKFGAWNLSLVEGEAPGALADLPAPDAVFIGGTKGGMEEIVDAVLRKNPDARLCITAIALETLSAAVAALTARGLEAEVTQLAVSRAKPAGGLHLLMANNPTFLVTAKRGTGV